MTRYPVTLSEVHAIHIYDWVSSNFL